MTFYKLKWGYYVQPRRITLSEVFDADNKFPDGTFLSPSADYPVTRVDGKSQGKITLTLVFEEEGNNLNLGLVTTDALSVQVRCILRVVKPTPIVF